MPKKWPRSRRQKLSHALVYAGFACSLCGFLCFALHGFIADADIVIAGTPISPLSSVRSNDDHLYLLYGDIPLVQVYDLDGMFQYNMSALPIPRKKYGGVLSMVADGRDLYLVTKAKDVYLWSNDVYVQSWTDEAAYEKWSELKEKYQYYSSNPSSAEGERYEIRSEDVWHVLEDGTAEKVVNRSWVFKLLNPTVLLLSPWPLFALGFIALVIGGKIRW